MSCPKIVQEIRNSHSEVRTDIGKIEGQYLCAQDCSNSYSCMNYFKLIDLDDREMLGFVPILQIIMIAVFIMLARPRRAEGE